jgi:hypothetical protein
MAASTLSARPGSELESFIGRTRDEKVSPAAQLPAAAVRK